MRVPEETQKKVSHTLLIFTRTKITGGLQLLIQCSLQSWSSKLFLWFGSNGLVRGMLRSGQVFRSGDRHCEVYSSVQGNWDGGQKNEILWYAQPFPLYGHVHVADTICPSSWGFKLFIFSFKQSQRFSNHNLNNGCVKRLLHLVVAREEEMKRKEKTLIFIVNGTSFFFSSSVTPSF